MIQAVLFDMDGLMVDTEPIHFQAFRAMMGEYGCEIAEDLMPGFVGFPEADNIRDLKRIYHLNVSPQEMAARRYAIFMQLIRTEPFSVFPGFWERSEEARRRGLKLAVVSSSTAEQVEVILRRLFATRPELGAPEGYFQAIVTGDDITRNKPAPDIYLLAGERLAVRPGRCLVFEDTPPGVESAVAAGMIAVGVPNDYSRNLDFPGARAVIGSLLEAAPYLDI